MKLNILIDTFMYFGKFRGLYLKRDVPNLFLVLIISPSTTHKI